MNALAGKYEDKTAMNAPLLGRRSGSSRLFSKDRGKGHSDGHLLPLPYGHRGHGFRAVVCQDGGSRETCDRVTKTTQEAQTYPEALRKRFICTGWENYQDWCISRRALVGTPDPSYYCKELLWKLCVARYAIKVMSKCGTRRDEDVLDTWFSSALWRFSLGWPEKTPSWTILSDRCVGNRL